MAVLQRSELEASPLADLHAIADQIGVEGFRRLRKADLIDAILDAEPGSARDGHDEDGDDAADARPARTRRRRTRRAGAASADEDGEDAEESDDAEGSEDSDDAPKRPRRGRGRSRRATEDDAGDVDADAAPDDEDDEDEQGDAPRGRRARSRGARGGRERGTGGGRGEREEEPGRVASGVVEVLGNGSAFLRVEPPEPSDDDVYISAAQVRRCELVTGDEVSGPVRTPRRSERYPSLVRVEEINGQPADAVSDGSRYEDLPVVWPSERIALGAGDQTVEAIQWLTPIGLGSRVVITGPSRAGKSETLRRLLAAVADHDGLEITLVLAGVRPEEIEQWSEGPVQPVAALSFAAGAEARGQAIERAIDAARRTASRGGHALVLLDTLDGCGEQTARRALAAARKLKDAGSLTLIATSREPLGGETTVIALDRTLTATGREPNLDLLASGTLRAELLVGEDGAAAIVAARAAALEA